MGALPGFHCISVPQVTKSRFAPTRCYKGKTLVDTMVQTRGQQTGDQPPSGRVTLRGVTAEGDAASTTVTSGNTLKHAVSAPSAEHSASSCPEPLPAVLAGSGSGQEEAVSPLGAGAPTTVSISAPMGSSMQPLSVVSLAGDGAKMTDSPGDTKGCSGVEAAVGGLASAGHHALHSVPPCRNTGQSTNHIRGSEQWSCDYNELRFSEWCV